MVNGAHVVLYSTNADADRAFLRDVLGLSNVDAGGGWLIFGLPPSEVAVHPAETSPGHELFLMCASVEAFVAEMAKHGLDCAPIQELRWGRLTQLTLPGGGTLGVYEPRHARQPAAVTRPRRAPAKKVVKKKAAAAGRGRRGRKSGRRR